MSDLLSDHDLEASSVVANNAMNRERQLVGVNSYTRELGFNPVDVLIDRVRRHGEAAWLDLCCGSGLALRQAAAELQQMGLAGRTHLTGVDLVDGFVPGSPVEFVVGSVMAWVPARRYDLITCVHGLHYLGDKLAVIGDAASWLTDDGGFIADFDAAGIRIDGVRDRRVVARLRKAGAKYDARRKRVTVVGRREIRLPYSYLGADDRAGPNYTGQPSVDSHYGEGTWALRSRYPPQ